MTKPIIDSLERKNRLSTSRSGLISLYVSSCAAPSDATAASAIAYADNRVGLRLRNRVRDAILCGRFGVCFIVFYFDFIHTDLLI